MLKRLRQASYSVFRLGYITALEDIDRTGVRPWRDAERRMAAARAYDRYVKEGPGA